MSPRPGHRGCCWRGHPPPHPNPEAGHQVWGWERFPAPYVPNAHFPDQNTEAQRGACLSKVAGRVTRLPLERWVHSSWSAPGLVPPTTPSPAPPHSSSGGASSTQVQSGAAAPPRSHSTPRGACALPAPGPLAPPPPLPLPASAPAGTAGSCSLQFRSPAGGQKVSGRGRGGRRRAHPSPGPLRRCLARGGHGAGEGPAHRQRPRRVPLCARGLASCAPEPPAHPHCGGGGGSTRRPAPTSPPPHVLSQGAVASRRPGCQRAARPPACSTRPPSRAKNQVERQGCPGPLGTPPARLTGQARRAWISGAQFPPPAPSRS